jgi:cell division protein FtsA
MAALVAREIEKVGPPALFPGGIVLTGGGALLRGFSEVTQQVTELPARVARPNGVAGLNDEIRGPHHATVVGLLRWGARRSSRARARAVRHNGSPHVGERLGRWVRELF